MYIIQWLVLGLAFVAFCYIVYVTCVRKESASDIEQSDFEPTQIMPPNGSGRESPQDTGGGTVPQSPK